MRCLFSGRTARTTARRVLASCALRSCATSSAPPGSTPPASGASPNQSAAPDAAPPPRKGHAEVDAEGFVAVNPAQLERLPREYRRWRVLKPKERQQLERFIYHAHYRPATASESDALDRDGLIASQMEVKWIEEHFARAAVAADEPDEVVVKRIQRAVLERADMHKPLAYIIGDQLFYDCRILCEPPILVPRPETETWTQWLCTAHLKGRFDGSLTVLDVCSGTGCIGVAIAKHVDNAFVQALDVDPQAVALTKRNAELAGVADRVAAMQSDMLAELLARPEHHHQYDILVSNPPYIHPHQWEYLEPAVRQWESPLALLGDERRRGKMVYYLELIRDAPQLLRGARKVRSPVVPHIVVEVGDQAELVASAFEASGTWREVNMHLDAFGKPRWVTAMLK